MTESRNQRQVPAAMALYGAWLKVLGGVAPRWADRVLARRFCTPQRLPASPARDLYGPATFVLHEGRQLPVWRAGQGPAVLLAHGWDSNAAFWDPMARAVTAAGYQAVAFDMPAHGSADGQRTTVVDMAAAIRAVARRLGRLHAVIGHSAGASAATFALADGLIAARAVLIAPAARPAEFIFPLAADLGLSHRRALGAVEALAADMGLDPLGPATDVVAAARKVPVPGLLVHDVEDRRVPWEHARAIADAWAGSHLISTVGLGHHRLASHPVVTDEVVAFVQGLPAARIGVGSG